MNPKGSAVDLFKSYQGKTGPNGETDTQLGMEALLKKRIKVSDKQSIDVQVYRKGKRLNELKKVGLFTYDAE